MGMGERKGRRIGGEGDCEGACERKRENKSKKQTHTERESEIETYCTYPPLPPAPSSFFSARTWNARIMAGLASNNVSHLRTSRTCQRHTGG